MNTRNLVTSLSQQLDTSCTDFPDGFEETQANQLQVSVTFVGYLLLSFGVHYFLKGLEETFRLRVDNENPVILIEHFLKIFE